MISKYQISLEELRTVLEKNPNITEEEWNTYSKKHNLFSSFTMQAHKDVYSWEQLKKSLNERDKDLDKKIEKTRKKLHNTIIKYGLSSKETIVLNNEMNELTIIYNKNEEYKYTKSGRIYTSGNEMYEAYKNSYMELEKMAKSLKRFPVVKEWNSYAKKQKLLSSQSIEYISRSKLE